MKDINEYVSSNKLSTSELLYLIYLYKAIKETNNIVEKSIDMISI